jgi:hypothetical protein
MQQELEDNVHFNMMLYLTLSSFVLSPQLREWYINPRSTHWRDVTLFHPQFFSNADFQRSFRMSRTSFNTLHQLLQPHIQKQDTRFRKAIPSTIRLSIFLYHVCLGVGYTAISNQFAVGKSTVSKIVGEVGTAICKVMGRCEDLRAPRARALSCVIPRDCHVSFVALSCGIPRAVMCHFPAFSCSLISRP